MATPEFTTAELETEEWRPIKGYEGVYEVSSLGRVRRIDRASGPRIMSTNSKKSYCAVRLSRPGIKPKNRRVHSLVAEAFLGPRPAGMTVNHKDLNKTNPRLDNLEYLTQKENIRHAIRNGVKVGGVAGVRRGPPMAPRGWRLTAADVIGIRRALLDGEAHAVIASRYGVSPGYIPTIKRGSCWGRVVELRDEVQAALGSPWKSNHKRGKYKPRRSRAA